MDQLAFPDVVHPVGIVALVNVSTLPFGNWTIPSQAVSYPAE